nr:hypothetical protein GCM10017606_24850 [Microbacterium terregens]
MTLRMSWTLCLLPALSLAVGCSAPQADPANSNRAPDAQGLSSPDARPSPPLPHSPPPAPGPNYSSSVAIALPGLPDTRGLDDAQLDAMFDAAVAQAQPGEEKRAVCVGMQGLADSAVTDAPPRIVQRLSEGVRLPAVPASQCQADVHPFVMATKANAILYTVKVESRDARGVLTFVAMATFGNLGAKGMQFRLVREQGRWTPRHTGKTIYS